MDNGFQWVFFKWAIQPVSYDNYHEEGNRMREFMEKFFTMVNYLKAKEEGQGLAEYALILVLVAIVCVAALIFLGGSINNVLNNVGANLAAQPGGGGS